MNSLPSCFIGQPARPGEILEISGEDSAHLIRVLRQREGQHVRLLDGRGFSGEGVIVEADSRECRVEVLASRQSARPIVRGLALCVPKAQKAEWVAQKAVELGLSHLDLILSDRSISRKNPSSRQERLDRILVSAMKQCGNPWLPEVAYYDDLAQWCLGRPEAEWYFGDLAEEALSLSQVLLSSETPSPAGVLIGPEGDFSDAERALLQQTCTPVRFTRFVLRSETAALYAASLLSPMPNPTPELYESP